MKKLLSALTATILAVSFALPLNAAPIFVPKSEQVQTGPVEQVRHRRHRHWHADHHWNRRYAWRSCRYYGRCYPRHYGYYGYRDYYRYHRRPGVSIYFNF
ncbi:hypothetical protein [Sinorhizobium psoraleae]|uniref:Uncharacterized protein n=1 Tax=Sinorhizobium psoraleae TaxID=520838 RepID=A0ABT4KM41_9HYPH|nr:hypothetical protein [Sinorhizobium psoraleae]MCZ4093026.1 hypothetical protein [Sinorhizobium psoraleae]